MEFNFKNKMARFYKIGEAISILQNEYPDLSASTLRFWEREGLIKPSERTSGDQRLYSDEDLSLIRYIKEMSLANYSIEKIKEKLIKEAREEEKGWDKYKGTKDEKLIPSTREVKEELKERFKRQQMENKLHRDLSLFEGLSEEEKFEGVYTKKNLANLLNIDKANEFINKAEKFNLIRPGIVERKKRYTLTDEMILKIINFLIPHKSWDSLFDGYYSHLASSVEYIYDLGIIEDFPANFEDVEGFAFYSCLYHLVRDNMINEHSRERKKRKAYSKSKKLDTED